jgi:hypothetical protein
MGISWGISWEFAKKNVDLMMFNGDVRVLS